MEDPSDGIILVMGVTGAGKSYFLNQLKSQSVSEGHSLYSETEKCQAVQIFLDEDEKRSITVVDTPGFDDTMRSQADILAEITDYLTAQHLSGLPLRGILYLHKISDNRMTKTSRNYLRLLNDIVGDDALKNVILVTTMWNTLLPEDRKRAVQREQELLNNFWSCMIDKGSYVAQFNGTPESAYPLIFQLADQESVVLDIQKEIVEQDQSIIETATGRTLVQQLETDHESYQMELCNLRDELERRQNYQPLDKAKIKQLKDEIAQVEKLLRAMSNSVDRMRVRPGSPMRERMKQAMKEHVQLGLGI
ncbi:triacylglycerol lipase II precursor [Fusarium beomiforme]|uniref:Triacylglycerol lipase II n=1 Tax=Fusarium beomiforme TaxID=44412 RepID=A0A9P5ASP8_9HYPO|nr:triacylglycerol lipase II precursor [Fusarium beomiforme]